MAENNRRETKYVLSAEDRTKQAFGSLTNSLKAADDKVIGLGAAFGSIAGLAGGGLVAGTVAIIKSAADAMDQFDDLSQKIGLSTEAISRWDYSAKFADVSTEGVATAVKKLSSNMFAAQSGGDGMQAVFKALNVEIESTPGILRNTDDVMMDIADRFEEMEDGAGKTALAVKIFGKAGSDLIPLLNLGSKGLREQAEEAKRFGLIISSEAAQAAAKFNDNLLRLKEAARGFGLAIANESIPWLNKMIEQMMEGTRIAGGFINALRLFGASTITTDNAGEKINELMKEREEIAERIVKLGGKHSGLQYFDRKKLKEAEKDLADVNKQLEYARLLQRQNLPGVQGKDEVGRRFDPGKKPPPALPDESKIKKAEDLLEKYRAKLADVNAEIMKAQGLDTEYSKMRHLLDNDKDMKQFSSAQRQQLLDAAILLDLEKQRQQVRKEQEAGEAENAKFRTDQSNKDIAELNELRNKYTELADPMKKFRDQLQEIERLREAFPELDNVWTEAQFKINEAMDQAMGLNKELEKTDDWAKELGLTFSSAFEEAIADGKKLSDVIKSLAQDIAKMLVRKNITEPIANGIGGIFKNIDFGGIFKNLFSSGSGGGGLLTAAEGTDSIRVGRPYLVGEEGPELRTFDSPGRIIPNDQLGKMGGGNGGGGNLTVQVYQSNHVDSRTDRAEIMAMLERSKQDTVAAVAQEVRRGGQYAKIIRGG